MNKSMEIFVGSTSLQKLDAVKHAARQIFPGQRITVNGRKAASEINEQPVGHEETIRGAMNRLRNLKTIIEGTRYDLLVAVENGILPVQIGDREAWFDLGWVVIEDAEGKQGFASSTGVEFNLADVEEARKRGFETTTAGSIIAERTGADSADPHAYLTQNAVTRSDMLQMALKTALGQLTRTTHLP